MTTNRPGTIRNWIIVAQIFVICYMAGRVTGAHMSAVNLAIENGQRAIQIAELKDELSHQPRDAIKARDRICSGAKK